jgi:NAD(P)-dependent dehydrogenase (short-subunit alcohol dehydrogenase family)
LTFDEFQTFAETNFLGHVLFTELLLINLVKAEGARVIHTSCGEYYRHNNGVLKFDDLVRKNEKYEAFPHAYATSKLMQIMYAKECQRIWEDKKILSFSFDPGFTASNLYSRRNSWINRELSYPVQRSIDQASYGAIYCALTEEAAEYAGEFHKDQRSRKLVLDADACRKVRELALQWVGLQEADLESKS